MAVAGGVALIGWALVAASGPCVAGCGWGCGFVFSARLTPVPGEFVVNPPKAFSIRVDHLIEWTLKIQRKS